MKEEFLMYAINVDKPYIVEEEDVEQFLENSKKQRELVAQMGSLFGSECFDFTPDENGLMHVLMEVEIEDECEN